ncbi:MAG: cadmium-translocating P-type ATPase [Bacteroidia bacterium]|nr:cadmium-translocating P-type ATPase [Bacteroidia bacterium]
MLHMFVSWAPLHNPFVQLILSVPVYALGLYFFGKSAINSLRSGVPNMDVLIFIGAASALFYSVFGTFYYQGTHEVHKFLFYETGASIITLVLFGNVLEKRSVKKTTNAIQSLSNLQVATAQLIIERDGVVSYAETEVKLLQKGDKIQINTGDIVPIDGVVIGGEADCDESLMSGESLPVHKTIGSNVIGGTHLLNGNLQITVSKQLRDTVLSQIIEMVKKAQSNKPNIQKLGDQISAIFVPAVILISLATFLFSYFYLEIGSAQSMLRAVAVLVISCPCAMGLATPTAIMVGIGKAAKRGILIKGGSVLEEFAKSKKIVFDKTGTLSTGHFAFSNFWFEPNSEAELRNLMVSLERRSSHPIAKAFVSEFSAWEHTPIEFKKVHEEKGAGMQAEDIHGNVWRFGSARWLQAPERNSDLLLSKNGKIVAGVSLIDEIKPGAKELISYFNKQELNSVVLSGDSLKKVESLSKELGVKEYYAQKLPQEKLEQITEWQKQESVVMVGDGVNDAPALSKVSVGVSFVKGSDIAIQAANVVLMREDIAALSEAHIISRQTYKTIKQNLFWAFFYNILCIPLAAAGYMHPMLGALSMAFSDVIVIGNSLLLGIKKVNKS